MTPPTAAASPVRFPLPVSTAGHSPEQKSQDRTALLRPFQRLIPLCLSGWITAQMSQRQPHPRTVRGITTHRKMHTRISMQISRRVTISDTAATGATTRTTTASAQTASFLRTEPRSRNCAKSNISIRTSGSLQIPIRSRTAKYLFITRTTSRTSMNLMSSGSC